MKFKIYLNRKKLTVNNTIDEVGLEGETLRKWNSKRMVNAIENAIAIEGALML